MSPEAGVPGGAEDPKIERYTTIQVISSKVNLRLKTSPLFK